MSTEEIFFLASVIIAPAAVLLAIEAIVRYQRRREGRRWYRRFMAKIEADQLVFDQRMEEMERDYMEWLNRIRR